MTWSIDIQAQHRIRTCACMLCVSICFACLYDACRGIAYMSVCFRKIVILPVSFGEFVFVSAYYSASNARHTARILAGKCYTCFCFDYTSLAREQLHCTSFGVVWTLDFLPVCRSGSRIAGGIVRMSLLMENDYTHGIVILLCPVRRSVCVPPMSLSL